MIRAMKEELMAKFKKVETSKTEYDFTLEYEGSSSPFNLHSVIDSPVVDRLGKHDFQSVRECPCVGAGLLGGCRQCRYTGRIISEGFGAVNLIEETYEGARKLTRLYVEILPKIT
jgi:hypothetical protein